MTTLIYTPGVSVLIQSSVSGLVDVSADVSSGSLSLRENGDHTLDLTLENPRRKYDGLFAPNDRIVVQLKRLTWVQVFAGYLSSVPYFSTYPQPVRLSAQCPLKVLKNWPWDEGSAAASWVIHGGRDTQAQDGGLAGVVERIMNEVVGWPSERIHIGSIPSSWKDKYTRVLRSVNKEVDELTALLGENPYTLAGGFGGGGAAGAGTVSGDGSQYSFAYGDIDVALATIRELESNNDYTAVNKGDGVGDWATGAYQFIDSTWENFRTVDLYQRAMDAPPALQDAAAEAMLRYYVDQHPGQLIVIPVAWYLPSALTDPTLLDKIPAEGEGNKLSIRDYALKWIAQYEVFYQQMRGKPAPTTGGAITTTSSTGIEAYPIPDGKGQLISTEVGWGGFTNGNIPSTAMSYSALTGQGHPLAVQAWNQLCVAAAADGITNLRGGMYRSYEDQVALQSGMGATAGKSNHGWGLAIDIQVLVGESEKFLLPEYEWLMANARKFGFDHPTWARQGGSKPEPWHWEFLAIYSFIGQTFDPETADVSLDPFTNTNTNSTMGQLFSAISMWQGAESGMDPESETLVGYKATMNDQPVMNIIDSLLRASGRKFCSAPNGDFMSWFPDYWGEFGTAGRMNVELIELQNFTVRWSDATLITHQFVAGATLPESSGPMPGGVVDAVQSILSKGVATIEMPGLLEAIINMPKGKADYPWLRDPTAFLKRFGARISREQVSTIFGPEQEFWFAISKFTEAWAKQFSASIPMTFMPELWPGMLLRIPAYGVQFYVQGVEHSWSMADGEGFKTQVSILAPSATDGSGFFMFPKAGAVSMPPDSGQPDYFVPEPTRNTPGTYN